MGHVHIQVYLVIRRNSLETVVPGVPRFFGGDRLEYAVVVVIPPGFLGDKKACFRTVLALDLPEVAGYLVHIQLSPKNPIPQKGIPGHERGYEDGTQEIPLHFRIDGIAPEGKGVLFYLVPQRCERNQVAENAGGSKTQENEKTYRKNMGSVSFTHAFANLRCKIPEGRDGGKFWGILPGE